MTLPSITQTPACGFSLDTATFNPDLSNLLALFVGEIRFRTGDAYRTDVGEGTFRVDITY